MINLNVKYLSNAYISSVADSFLKQNNIHSIPIDIDGIIDLKYKINIVPVPGMLALAETDGLCSTDCTEIYVDYFVYKERPFRYRFTLAHELGHIILHKRYYDKIRFSSVTQWVSAIDKIDSNDRSKMKHQANMFAGMVLVPTEILRVEFNKQLQLIQSQLEKAKSNGISREAYLPTMLDSIANELSPKFEVSRDVLRIRIEFEHLQEEIP